MHRVLIADDNAELRTLLSRILAMDGYEIASVGDGEELIRLLQVEAFDAVILDFHQMHSRANTSRR